MKNQWILKIFSLKAVALSLAVAIVILVVFSIFFSLPIQVSGLIGGVIGSMSGGLAIYLAEYSIKQKEWAREGNIKVINEVYLPLYQELIALKNIILSYPQYPTPASSIAVEKWEEAKRSGLTKLIPDDLKDKISQVYDVRFPDFMQKYDKAYNSIFDCLKDYFLAFSTDKDDNKLRNAIQVFYTYLKATLFETVEVQSAKLGKDNYASYINSTESMLKSYGINLPQDFLNQIKNKVDAIQDVVDCKDILKKLIESCNVAEAQLENYILKPWQHL